MPSRAPAIAAAPRPLKARAVATAADAWRQALPAAGVCTWTWHVGDEAACGPFGSIHPEDQDGFARFRAAVATDAMPAGADRNFTEYRTLTAEGEIRWQRCHCEIAARNSDGSVATLVGVSVDITDFQRSEALLRVSEQRRMAVQSDLDRRERHEREQAVLLNALPSSARVGLATHDTQLRFVVVNDIFAEFLGVPVSSLIGRTRRDLAPDLADRIEPLLRQVLLEKRPVEGIEITYARPDRSGTHGAARTWLTSFYPVRGIDGECVGVGEAMLDITEKRRSDDKTRQAERLQTVGRLAAGVAHDFNNILHIVIGNLDLLDDAAIGNAQSRSLITMAIRAAQRGAYLTQQMLSYTRQQLLTPKRLDVTDVFTAVRVLLERALGPGIDISVEVRRPISDVVADRAQLETALINLGVNAGQAMPGGGRLRFDISETDGEPFGELRPGRYVVIATIDTGDGIPAEILDRVFEPFFTTKGFDGTGLGLSMVQGFSRQSGGDARVLSTLGKGTRVEIWLPVAPQPVLVQEAAKPVLSRGHILLVDDVADALATTAAFLERDGFSVRQVASAAEAACLVDAGNAFDLLITDYMMPGMNGVELVEHVRQSRPDIPAILITGFAEIIDYVPDQHGARLLRKPFRREQLLREVETLISLQPAPP